MRSTLFALCGLVCVGVCLADEPAKKQQPAENASSSLLAVLADALAGTSDPVVVEKAPALPKGTHETTKTIPVKGEASGVKLQTLTSGPDGLVYALLGSDRYGKKVSKGEVQVFDSAGTKVHGWKVDFQCQAINCAPDGTVLVAGDGKIAAFDAKGELKSEVDLPFIKEILGDAEKLKERAEEQRKSEIESYQEVAKNFKDQVEELEKKDKESLTKAEKAQLNQAKSMVKSYDSMLERTKKKKIEDLVEEIASRVKIVNSVAAADKDIFVVSGELKGYGYAVWRMDRKFENPKQVLTGVRGCCGQMDVQCCGDELVVAQNCEHNVGRYSLDGKKLSTFGKRAGREASPDGFGGCCNPMNVRGTSQGKIYTAESEGIVRVFSADGKPEGIVGSVKITGGCKNVAIAASADGNTIWFCDQPGSKIHIMTRKAESAEGVREQR